MNENVEEEYKQLLKNAAEINVKCRCLERFHFNECLT